MSRKHPDRLMLIPLNAQERAALRVRARGRSLGDALRRLVQAGLSDGTVPLIYPAASTSRLPLQLPSLQRQAVAVQALQQGCTPEELVRAFLQAGLKEAQLKSCV